MWFLLVALSRMEALKSIYPKVQNLEELLRKGYGDILQIQSPDILQLMKSTIVCSSNEYEIPYQNSIPSSHSSHQQVLGL
jgi:hypothetical protein